MAQERELRAKLKELRDHIVKNADNVGERFPNEARKMHYGDIEHRPIYGEASPDEARALIDEGVEVSPLPVLPDDRQLTSGARAGTASPGQAPSPKDLHEPGNAVVMAGLGRALGRYSRR